MDGPKGIALWLLVAMLSVATLVLYVDNFRTKDCIAHYMVADQQASIARAGVTDLERTAFLYTLKSITDTKGSPATRKKAIDDYIALVNKDNDVRQQNPIRSVPTRCS